MKTQKTTCIILGNKSFGESHKLIYLYSKEFGKIKVIAKGARKITSRFTGHLETLNICTAELYFGPKNIILTEITTIKNSKRIRGNLEKCTSALKIAEISNKLIYENQSFEDLSGLIEETIDYINKSKKSSLIALSYIIKLLDKIGLIPNSKIKFLEFLKKPFREIEKSNHTKQEEQQIKTLVTRILEHSLSI